MDGRFQPRQRSQGKRSQDSGDRRLDQWIETGRQLVDGVAGTRPGRRAAGGARPSVHLESVGRWVGDKIDWLMDEEEDWGDPVEPPLRTESMAASSRKRPLDAISRRQGVGQQIVAPVPAHQVTFGEADNSWPDDESFRVERWSRSAPPPSTASSSPQPLSRGSSRRPLPRSSRRRD
ncbi:RNA helicase [bacterium]|nr:RNA helicase [bacterium]